MFTRMMKQRVPEEKGISIWDQCLEELQKSGCSHSVEDVNRLALLVTHDIQGEFQKPIWLRIHDVVNGFLDELPF